LKRIILAACLVMLFSCTVYGQELSEELADVVARFSGRITVGEVIEVEDFTLVPLIRLRVLAGESRPGALLNWSAAGLELEPVAMVVIREGELEVFPLNGHAFPALFPLPEPEPEPELSEEEQAELFQKGLRYLQEGEAVEARNIFESLLLYRPECADTHAFLGWAYADLADRASELEQKIEYGMDAFREFSWALEIDPDNPYALTARGYARLVVPPPLGGADLAKEDFTRALDKDSSNVEARLGLAQVYVSQGDEEKAREHYRIILEMDPDNERAGKGLRRLEEGEGE